MCRVQRLNRNLHQLAPRLHHFVNFSAGLVDNSAPLSRNPKALNAFYFILVIEPALSDLHSLSDICTDRMLGIYDGPRVTLEDEYRSGAVPEVVKECFEWNILPDLRKFVGLLESVIDLLLVLFYVNCL